MHTCKETLEIKLKSVEFVKVALKRNGFVSSFVIAAKR
jgi:hypothetical protein